MGRLLGIAVLVGLACGCGPPDPRSRSFEVSGSVTFDGEPVADGAITLFPDDPTLPADAGTIVNGRYRFLASAGKKRVEIRASREVPQAGPANVPRDPRFEEYIPARYNEKSDLSLTVTPDGKNTHDFALESKGPR